MKNAVLFLLLFCWATAVWGDSYSDQYSKLNELTFLVKLRLVLDPNAPDWLKIAIWVNVAEGYFADGQVEEGIKHLENAVNLGFNDFVVIRKKECYRKAFSSPQFAQLYYKMRISEADTEEINWIYKEEEEIRHDTDKMIQENTNRLDSDFTEVPQVKIPERVPQSPTILALREDLRLLQKQQLRLVAQSDTSRIQHNMNSNILRNMGEDNGDGYQDELAKETSRQLARQIAEKRREEVKEREFVLPGYASTDLKPCPALEGLANPGPSESDANKGPSESGAGKGKLEGGVSGEATVGMDKPKQGKSKVSSQRPEQDVTETSPAGRYKVLRSGVIRDTKTGLDWYVGPDENTTWDDAKAWVERLRVDGGGWRMPTMEELKGLYEKGKGSKNIDPVFKTKGSCIWSGQLHTDSYSAWYFSLSRGSEKYIRHSWYGGCRGFAVRVGKQRD